MNSVATIINVPYENISIKNSIGKVVVQITGTSNMELEQVSNIYNHIKSQLKTDTPILLGVTKNEDFKKTVVETFIYCLKV